MWSRGHGADERFREESVVTVDYVGTLAAASEPVRQSERDAVLDAARVVAVLALVYALEHPEDDRDASAIARGSFRGASAERVAALTEPLRPAYAHAVVEA